LIGHLNEVSGAGGTGGNWKGASRILVGEIEGKRLLKRPRRRWEGYIKVAL
jgi:hypothetical protein